MKSRGGSSKTRPRIFLGGERDIEYSEGIGPVSAPPATVAAHRRCSCEQYRVRVEDRELVDVTKHDPTCRVHGFPSDRWPSGHPLRRYALEVEHETGKLWHPHDAHRAAKDESGRVFIDTYMCRFRTETPQETEARLFGEAAA